MLSYYGFIDVPVIGDIVEMRRFKDTLRSMSNLLPTLKGEAFRL